jgi:hypothetical protein
MLQEWIVSKMYAVTFSPHEYSVDSWRSDRLLVTGLNSVCFTPHCLEVREYQHGNVKTRDVFFIKRRFLETVLFTQTELTHNIKVCLTVRIFHLQKEFRLNFASAVYNESWLANLILVRIGYMIYELYFQCEIWGSHAKWISLFWVTAPSTVLTVCRRFTEMYCLHRQL